MSNYIYLRRILIFLTVLFVLSSCRSVPVITPGVHISGHGHGHAHGRGAYHNYYYYPDVEVYFDIGRRSYFYFTDGIWRISATLPHALRLHLGSHVSLELNTAEPYHLHPSHRKHYPRGYFKKKHKKQHKKKYKKKHNKGNSQHDDQRDYDDGHDNKRGKGRGHDRDYD